MRRIKPENEFFLTSFWNYLKGIDKYWLVTWAIIFVSFMTTDAISRFHFGEVFWGTTVIKYTGILLCYIYAVRKFPKDYLLQIAMLFTLLADTILIFDSTSLAGVFVFCLAQYFHISRFAGAKPMFFIPWTIFVLLVFYFGLTARIDPMYALAIVYGSSLILNIRLSARWVRRVKKHLAITPVSDEKTAAENMSTNIARHTGEAKVKVTLKDQEYRREVIASSCALAGFILFACCDTCVAVSYLSHTHILPAFLGMPMDYIDWAFYYPSQVLVSNSSAITDRPAKKSKQKVKKAA